MSKTRGSVVCFCVCVRERTWFFPFFFTSFGNDPFEAFGSFFLFLGLFLSCCCWVGLLVGFVKEESWEEGKKKKKKLSVVGCVCVCGFFV